MNKFSCNSSQYAEFRPQYPDLLFKYLKAIAGNGYVLDCGSGSGQCTQKLSYHFQHVIAADLSFELLNKAITLSNVYYIQSSAEKLPIRSTSIDLICVAQAIHWFSLNEFYSEVKRVLKPNGIIAAWCYNQAEIEPKIDDIIKKVYLKIISSSQIPSRERQYLYGHYQALPFPFERILTPNFNLEMNWNLMQWIGYMNTWPSILEYKKKFGINLVSEIEEDLSTLWGDHFASKSINWSIHLLVGRVQYDDKI